MAREDVQARPYCPYTRATSLEVALLVNVKYSNRISKEKAVSICNKHTQNNIPTKVNNVTRKPDVTPFGAAAAVTGRNVDVGTGTGTGNGM